MHRTEEFWDWPPRRRKFYRRPPRYNRTVDIDAYPATGWNSPRVTKVVDIYVHVVITAIKMLIAVPLSVMLFGSLWLLWVLITL
jgi:hypothetical protein